MKYLLFLLLVPIINLNSKELTKTDKKDVSIKQSKINLSTTTTNVVVDKNIKKAQEQGIDNENDNYGAGVEAMSFEGSDNTIEYSEQGDVEKEGSDKYSIPYSYGVFKGSIVLNSKTFFVFEGDDGTINLVYIYIEGDKIKWKLYYVLNRKY